MIWKREEGMWQVQTGSYVVICSKDIMLERRVWRKEDRLNTLLRGKIKIRFVASNFLAYMNSFHCNFEYWRKIREFLGGTL